VSIEKLQENYPVQIRWIPFPLHPETPQEGRSLSELFAGRDIEPMKRQMRELMAEAGLEYGERTHTYNSRLAQELAKWADTQEGGQAIHDALYRAYFVDNINLSDIGALVEIASDLNLDGNLARQIIEQRSFRDAVDADWERARQLGITGVPTFYKNDLAVVGCQPYETLERFVQHLMQTQNDE
jgi:predicted DsbA family dithiol-disulfide isomerase